MLPLEKHTEATTPALCADLDAIVTSVQKLSGLTVQQFHAEGGGGQFELATAHTDAFAAADALVLQREAVVDTAARRGRPASFLPKLWDDRSASGAHMHFSVYKVKLRLCLAYVERVAARLVQHTIAMDQVHNALDCCAIMSQTFDAN